MSEENVETVRRHTEAWNRRDLTTWLTLFHRDGELDWSRSRGPLKGVYRGEGEFEVFWDAFWSTFKDVQVEWHGFTEVGSEVVVPNTAHIRGRQGIEVIARSSFVFTVGNGQITRLRMFQEQAEALEAAGLSEWAMSEENVEVISRAIDAWNRGDLDGFLAGAHPDIEWHPVLPAGVEGSGGLYRGHDEARKFWAEFWAMFDEFRITIQSARAVGTSVLVLAQIQGRAHSGVPLDTPWGAVFEMRDGLCVKTEAFLDHESALEAAGLRE